MRFSEREIQLAARMRGAGLAWAPGAGHYVLDIDGVLRAASPFQAGVHLVTSANALASLAGGVDELSEGFAWLPTWSDATAWLLEQGVERQQIVDALQGAIDENQSDLEAVYGLILDTLERKSEAKV